MTETNDGPFTNRASRTAEPWSEPESGFTFLRQAGGANVIPATPAEFKAAQYGRLSGRQPNLRKWLRKTRRIFKPGAQIVSQGESGGRAFMLEQGWTFSSCVLRNGHRQVIDVQVPGDVANLQGLILPFALQDVTAITEVEISELVLDTSAGPGGPDAESAAFLLWLIASEGAVISARLMNLGRRTAIERMAHFILELEMRLKLVGLGTASGFPCPMTQYLIADVLGLTPVHVNRVFRELRLSRLVSHHRGWLSLIDKGKLAGLAQFDGAYLQHEGLSDT